MAEGFAKPLRFRSTYPQDVDAKRRIQIPSKWRPISEDSEKSEPKEFMLILQSFQSFSDGYILVMPMELFEKIEDKLDQCPLLDPESIMVKRFLGSRSESVTMDGSGRITLPAKFAERVEIGFKGSSDGFSNQVVLQGEIQYFTIWNVERYNLNNSELQDVMNVASIENTIRKLGI